MNIQNLVLDINKKCNQLVTANVGEVDSRLLRISVIDNGVPMDLTGITVYLYAKKADGTKVFNSVTVEDAKQGIISVEITSQVLAIEGFVKLTLLLTKDKARLASKIFTLKVDETIVDDEALESSNEFKALDLALDKADKWNGYFEETSGKIEEKYTERLNQVDLQLAYNEKYLDDIFININKYKERIVNNDLTEVLQELVNKYSKIYIPSGEYTLSNLIIPSDTEIVCSSEALITLNGVISNKVDIIKNWSIQSSNPVNTGDTIITLSDTSLLNQVSVGDTVMLYNNGWMPEDEWLVESEKENVEFKSWQIAVVKNVGVDNIELDLPIEFSSDTIRISYHNQSENIKICGGKWITNSGKAININKCKNLQLCNMVIDNKVVTVPLYLEYIYDSKIKYLNMISISNACIWVARGSKNVKISDSVFKVKDEFSGDATIMVFDSCKYVDVYNNELELNHYKAPSQSKIKIGICIHTVSTFCNVYNNYVKGYSHGLASYFGAKHNIFRNNTAELCGTGMYLHKSSYTKICSNIFRQCNDSRIVYASVTGGVSFQLSSYNYKIDVIENIFIETGKGINAGSNLTDCNFNGNTFVNCLGITSGASNITHRRINIAYNKFINSENSKYKGIDYYPIGRNMNINNNTFENVTDAIRLYGSVQFSNIYCNSCMNADRFLHIRQNGYGNQIFHNIINTAVLGFSQEAPASLSNFYNNVLLDVETHYNFTDSYNMNNQTYRGNAPIGFRCYSIEPTSDYIYYEKITEGNTLGCWQKVKKYV